MSSDPIWMAQAFMVISLRQKLTLVAQASQVTQLMSTNSKHLSFTTSLTLHSSDTVVTSAQFAKLLSTKTLVFLRTLKYLQDNLLRSSSHLV